MGVAVLTTSVTIVVRLISSRSGRGTGGRGGGASRFGTLSVLFLLLLARASNARDGNVIRPSVNGEHLQDVRVVAGQLRLLLGQTQGVVVVLGIVVDEVLGDDGDVQDAMEQVNGPVCVEG